MGIKEKIREQKERNEERIEEIKEGLREKGYEIDEDMEMRYDFCDGLRVYLNNKKYVEWDGWEHNIVKERNTDYGRSLEYISDEFEREIIEFEDIILMINYDPEYIGDSVWVKWFLKKTGNKIPNKRTFRKAYETSKGWYINQNGERIYFKRKGGE